MFFWKKKKHWEDEYDEYYTRDIERGGKAPAKWRYIPHVLGLLFLGALFGGAVGVVSGPKMLEAMLTSLAMPIGILWVALIFLVYFCLLHRQAWPAMTGIACWLLLTLAGNGPITNWLANSLEAPYQNIDAMEGDPYDLIVVLGGGTSTRLSGRPQGTHSGDRLITAASLYHAGKSNQLMCTGVQPYRSTEDDLHPFEEAARLLVQLNVPEKSILKLRGANTSEEMQNLKEWIDKNPGKARVGLLTSAWHLPRALRLAKTNGMELLPIPSNFLSAPFAPSPDIIIPSGDNLAKTALMTKEDLARLVSR